MSRLEDGFKATIQPVLEEHTTRQDYESLKAKIARTLPVNFEGIPSELRGLKQWVVWKHGIKGPNDRPIFNPLTRKPASSTNLLTWGTLEQAKAAYETGYYHGVGFVLTGGIICVDLDHCVNYAGYLDELASDAVSWLESYAEISQSGTGVHIFLRGHIPGDKKKVPGIEVYETSRYISVTGKRLDGVPLGVQDSQEMLDIFYQDHFQQSTRMPRPSGARPIILFGPERTDEEAIAAMLARKNAWKVRPLFEGDLQGSVWRGVFKKDKPPYGPDYSRYDLQLVQFLWYASGYRKEQTDRLFRLSGLMREKWDQGNPTYGERTIAKVIADWQASGN